MNNADVTYEDGKLVIKGGDAEGSVSWTPNAAYDLVEKALCVYHPEYRQGFRRVDRGHREWHPENSRSVL